MADTLLKVDSDEQFNFKNASATLLLHGHLDAAGSPWISGSQVSAGLDMSDCHVAGPTGQFRAVVMMPHKGAALVSAWLACTTQLSWLAGPATPECLQPLRREASS